jgi:DNA polymerase
MTAWQSALRKQLSNPVQAVADRLSGGRFSRPVFRTKDVDFDHLVSLDFETYFDDEYTLKKLSTSEYVRDPRFKAQMLYLKVGKKAPRIIPAAKIATELQKIDWSTHAVLCHHTQFDGLILSHHYGVVPHFYYDTLSMARGLHSNEIGAGLDEVSAYYGGKGKLEGILEKTKGVRDWSPTLFKEVTPYCLNDGDEMLRVFNEMIWSMPIEEIDLIDIIVRMFCAPVLRLDIPRIEAELTRELAERETLLRSIIDVDKYRDQKLVKGKEKLLPQLEQDMIIIKRVIGSNERFANLLRDEDVDPPVKISPAWMKRSADEREATLDEKWSFAFAKDDIEFVNLPEDQTRWTVEYDLNDPDQVKLMAEKSERLRSLVDARIAVKSTTNVTRAERLLISGADGMCLPVYYAYSRAHTHRLGGGDKRNPQNLKRGGELRQSILAPDDHVLVVGDSGQIECRVNGHLWGQKDLLDSFRAADLWDKSKGVARGNDRDAYCKFADSIYGREITTLDKMERFVGKVCVLGLGFQMGPAKLQITLAKGALGGPPVFFPLEKCKAIVETYRRLNYKIKAGWDICGRIIEDMAAGREGGHGPISWEKDCIWLPNGMRLHYPDLKKATGDKGWDEWTYGSTLNGQPIRKKIYGGLLDENIVQALARIIVMYQMLDLSKVMRMVMTTHDEMVACVKKRNADKALQLMMARMTQPLPWCPDIPLAAEGGYDINYSK